MEKRASSSSAQRRCKLTFHKIWVTIKSATELFNREATKMHQHRHVHPIDKERRIWTVAVEAIAELKSPPPVSEGWKALPELIRWLEREWDMLVDRPVTPPMWSRIIRIFLGRTDIHGPLFSTVAEPIDNALQGLRALAESNSIGANRRKSIRLCRAIQIATVHTHMEEVFSTSI